MIETELHLLKTQVNLFDAYHTLIDGDHIFLPKILISKNWMKQNDENLSELDLNLFWYKLHKKVFVVIMLMITTVPILYHI